MFKKKISNECNEIEIKKEFLKQCMELLKNSKKIDKILYLIHSFLDQTEKNGLGSLKPHSSLFKGELISLNLTNEVTYGSDVQSKGEVKIYSNKTIFDLRVLAAKEFKTSWERVKRMGLYVV